MSPCAICGHNRHWFRCAQCNREATSRSHDVVYCRACRVRVDDLDEMDVVVTVNLEHKDLLTGGRWVQGRRNGWPTRVWVPDVIRIKPTAPGLTCTLCPADLSTGTCKVTPDGWRHSDARTCVEAIRAEVAA